MELRCGLRHECRKSEKYSTFQKLGRSQRLLMCSMPPGMHIRSLMMKADGFEGL
jgi:hypothetical protein